MDSLGTVITDGLKAVGDGGETIMKAAIPIGLGVFAFKFVMRLGKGTFRSMAR